MSSEIKRFDRVIGVNNGNFIPVKKGNIYTVTRIEESDEGKYFYFIAGDKKEYRLREENDLLKKLNY